MSPSALPPFPERPRLIVLAEPDPVARGVAERWGTPVSSGAHVDGAPIRELGRGVLVLRRPGPHLHDERLEQRLPEELRGRQPTVVFPSVHRSERGDRCLTVHPLGNPGPRADLGGRPRTLVPTDPGAMAAVLRALYERGRSLGVPATFEATHHGPELELPAFFAEVAVKGTEPPPTDEIGALADALAAAVPEPGDRVALAAGGGHYAPRFTDLVRTRRWAFGHILSRYAIEEIDRPTALAAYAGTPGAQGWLPARALDRHHPALEGVGPVLVETDAPTRSEGVGASVTSTSPRTSGT